MSAEKPLDIELQELLAFELFSQTHPDSTLLSHDDMAKLWRKDPSTRKNWRDFAAQFAIKLNGKGLAVRVKKSTAVHQALKELITIPEQPAYKLGDD